MLQSSEGGQYIFIFCVMNLWLLNSIFLSFFGVQCSPELLSGMGFGEIFPLQIKKVKNAEIVPPASDCLDIFLRLKEEQYLFDLRSKGTGIPE